MAAVNVDVNSKYNGAGIKQAQDGLASLGTAIKTTGDLMKGLVALKGVQELASFVSSSLDAYKVQEQAISQLTVAIGNNASLTGASLQRLISYTGELQKKSIYGDELLQGQATLLAAMGLTEEQIKKTLDAAVELSSAGVGTLDGNVKNLAKTFGGMTGELGESIPALKKLTKEQLMHGDAIDLVKQRYNGFAQNLATGTLSGQLSQLSNNFGDLKEQIGAAFAPIASPFIMFISDIISRWTEAIGKVNEYNSLVRKGEKATLEEQLRIKQIELERLQNGRMIDLKGAGLGDFETWLKNTRAQEGMSGLSTHESNSPASRASYMKEYSRQRDAFLGNGDDAEIIALKKAIGELTVQLQDKKEDERPTEPGASPTAAPGDGINSLFLLDPSKLDFSLGGAGNLDFSSSYTPAYQPTDLGLNINPFADMGKFGDGIAKVIGGLDSFIGSLGGAIGSFSSIVALMSPIQIIITSFSQTLEPLVDQLLAPLIGALSIIGISLGKILVPVLKLLEPIITAVSYAFLALYNYAIKPFANAIIWLTVQLNNTIARAVNAILSLIDKIPGISISYRMDKLDYEEYKLQTIGAGDLTKAGADYQNSSSSSSATYTGVKDLTINIYYENSYVNGDARAIALNLRDEIKLAEAVGM